MSENLRYVGDLTVCANGAGSAAGVALDKRGDLFGWVVYGHVVKFSVMVAGTKKPAGKGGLGETFGIERLMIEWNGIVSHLGLTY